MRAGTDLDIYLERALDVPVSQREEWLQELESREPTIAAGIRRLLAAEATERFASFLNEPVAPAPAPRAIAGELIGRFRILHEIGQGGMAVVYLAEAEPLLVNSVKQLGILHYDRRLALQRLIRLYELKGELALARQQRDELAAFQQQARLQ